MQIIVDHSALSTIKDVRKRTSFHFTHREHVMGFGWRDSPLGFGLLALRAAQTLACATPAAKNSPQDCFLHAAT